MTPVSLENKDVILNFSFTNDINIKGYALTALNINSLGFLEDASQKWYEIGNTVPVINLTAEYARKLVLNSENVYEYQE